MPITFTALVTLFPQVASSTWTYNLVNISGRKPYKYGNYIIASELFSLEEEELLSDKNKAMIPKNGCNVHVLSKKSNC